MKNKMPLKNKLQIPQRQKQSQSIPNISLLSLSRSQYQPPTIDPKIEQKELSISMLADRQVQMRQRINPENQYRQSLKEEYRKYRYVASNKNDDVQLKNINFHKNITRERQLANSQLAPSLSQSKLTLSTLMKSQAKLEKSQSMTSSAQNMSHVRYLNESRGSSKKNAIPKTQRRNTTKWYHDLTESILTQSRPMWRQAIQNPQNEGDLKLNISIGPALTEGGDAKGIKINKYQEITETFHQIDLQQKIYPVSMEYFAPVTLAMNCLRNQALKTSGFEQNIDPFFRASPLQAKLWKGKDQEFTLTLRNTGNQPLLVGFKDMNYYHNKNQIQIISWGNKSNKHFDPSFPLVKNRQLDIKFKALINDFNFKFMPFDMAINGVDFFMVLPISLLDMSQPQKVTIRKLREFDCDGKAMQSEPFNVENDVLPEFMGGFSFVEEVTARKGDIVGGCILTLPYEQQQNEDMNNVAKKVIILAKLLNRNKKMINLICLKENQDDKTFSYAYLQLMIFLMVQQQ